MSSRWRAAPRESSRLATLAHAMSSTSATAQARTTSAGRTRASCRRRAAARARRRGRPCRRRIGRRRSRCVARRGGPFCLGLLRRHAGPQSSQRREDHRAVGPSASAGITAGIQNRTRGVGNASSGRATPTIVRIRSSMFTTRPTMGIAAELSRHSGRSAPRPGRRWRRPRWRRRTGRGRARSQQAEDRRRDGQSVHAHRLDSGAWM